MTPFPVETVSHAKLNSRSDRNEQKTFSRASTVRENAGYLPSSDTLPECDEVELRKALGAMSSSEQHMARFFLSLWTGKPADFDLIDAVSVVEVEDRKLIIEWTCKPFWP
nr:MULTISPECIES: hypothetical protein [Serratia]ULG12104.1 hypothetical protein D1p1_00072 [Serratia entomophila]ULG12382.1 hypothetical protein M3p_00086 [Serratia entomophila]ULG16029.1 hypothetical protein 591p_00179 [Serratia proteamaculans]ULG18417.1 hypothetical protein Man4p_00100 [Serratia proteamaculans]